VTATSQHVFEDKAVEQNWASALEQKPTTERAQIVRADYSKLIASGPRQEVAARKKNMRLLCNETAIISHYGCVPRLFGKRFYNFWNYFPILDAGGRCHFYSMGASFVYAERMRAMNLIGGIILLAIGVVMIFFGRARGLEPLHIFRVWIVGQVYLLIAMTAGIFGIAAIIVNWPF
jgi:hypothetical protein